MRSMREINRTLRIADAVPRDESCEANGHLFEERVRKTEVPGWAYGLDDDIVTMQISEPFCVRCREWVNTLIDRGDSLAEMETS